MGNRNKVVNFIVNYLATIIGARTKFLIKTAKYWAVVANQFQQIIISYWRDFFSVRNYNSKEQTLLCTRDDSLRKWLKFVEHA